ncbi:MAG: AAA family ATPase, partial [Clostridiales Family XIII bacterium]|nr:AAA family ATPase [Clostridiales Family XIII bacterium]
MKLVDRPKYIEQLHSLRDRHLVKVVTGVRRCGKSTLLEMFADELRGGGVAEAQIQFYNFEDPDIYAIGDWKQMYDHIKARLLPDKMNYVFLDEVQNVDTFERLVDGLFIKKNCDVYITGSNAYFLSGELATLLTGRYLEIEMYPYSYQEYVQFLKTNESELEQAQNPRKFTKTESFAEFVYFGGIPEANNLMASGIPSADAFVKGVLNTIIEKDIFARHRVNNRPAFEKVIDFVLDSSGMTVSPKEAVRNKLDIWFVFFPPDCVAFFPHALACNGKTDSRGA